MLHIAQLSFIRSVIATARAVIIDRNHRLALYVTAHRNYTYANSAVSSSHTYLIAFKVLFDVSSCVHKMVWRCNRIKQSIE